MHACGHSNAHLRQVSHTKSSCRSGTQERSWSWHSAGMSWRACRARPPAMLSALEAELGRTRSALSEVKGAVAQTRSLGEACL